MRWPLRNQILIRLLTLVIVAIVAITFANIRSVSNFNQRQYESRISQISELLVSIPFPITDGILDNMTLLSGAEFAQTDVRGILTAKSKGAPMVPDSLREPADLSGPGNQELDLAQEIEIEGKAYSYARVGIQKPGRGLNHVHIFVSQEDVRDLWWRSIQPPLWIASIILPLALIVSLAMASNLTRPLADLQEQVSRIANGQREPIETGARQDEIHDLTVSMNEMAKQLQDRDDQVRRNERLNTLLQMGSGIAHNLKNCATGCKMAVELLASEQPEWKGSENLQVAKRQLDLMSKYIDRFMTLSKTGGQLNSTLQATSNLATTLDSVVFLVRPSAEHLNVKLALECSCDNPQATIAQEDAEQLMINLINNAITAASEFSVIDGKREAFVQVTLSDNQFGRIELTVADNGAGPPPEIASSILEPFVSGTRDGAGLGLSLAQDIVDRANGELSWQRVEDQTIFCIELNRAANGI